MAILEVNGLKKIYTTRFGGSQVTALSDVSFSVEKGEYVADETYKSVEGGHFVEGNLPRNESQGVHTVDDLVVTARGPKSEEIKGFMNSTEIFRVMAEALALGH